MPAVAIVGALVAYIFVYAGIKGSDPRDILVQFLSGLTAPKKLAIPDTVKIPSGKVAKKSFTGKREAGAKPVGNVKAMAKMTKIWTQVHARFPQATFSGISRDPSRGLNQCANPSVSGSCRYSQHNHNNALDIGVPVDSKLGDDIARWLKANRTKLKVRNILWRVANHHDHIHVDGEPAYCGVPPGKPC